MERVKVALLGVIAVSLVVEAGADLVPTAHAQSTGPVACEAFLLDDYVSRKELPGGVRERFEPVRAWLEAHPGDVVYRTDNFGGYILVCVRG
jgi:hypothetical protein